MKAKKSLGQNFLKSHLALRKMIEAGELKEDDVVLEIGPGKGVLTKELLASGAQVIAVEKDRELFALLQNKFATEIQAGTLVLVHDDILQFQITNYELRNYKIIANIPYNITGAILKKFLTAHPPAGGQPERMILMVQHEVAKRIVANDGKESILSISVKAYGEPKMVMKVPARYFSPAPKVDSAVIAIKNISRKTFTENNVNEGKFWEIVKKGFAHKRKKLSSNLRELFTDRYGGNASVLEIFSNKRAEDLLLENWIHISKN